MSKVWISCISFLVGVLATTVLLKSDSVSAQATQAVSDLDPAGHPRSILENVGVVAGPNYAIGGLEDIPRFRPLNASPILKSVQVLGGHQILDGLDCRSCSFQDAQLSYGGGPFNLQDAHFSGSVSLTLEGAAANTVNMLNFLNLLQKPTGPIVSPKANKPIIHRAIVKRSPTAPINFGPSFIGNK